MQALALSLFVYLVAMFAAAAPGAGTAEGELFFVKLANAPFPHPSRREGLRYDGKKFPAETHYQDDRVVIFIPPGFRPGTNVDLVVHFHGWRARIDQALVKFQLASQFTESGRNALFIAPQGPLNAPDSSGGKLEDRGGFKRFVEELLVVLRERRAITTQSVGRIVLSGHSGGYKVIASILAVGGLTPQVEEVYLFDALYGEKENYIGWLDRQRDSRLILIHTKAGGTRAQTERFAADLRLKSIPALFTRESEATLDQLRTNRIAILSSDLSHDEVMFKHHNFRDYLATSRLDARPVAAKP